jgi:hypothetical protein
MDKSKIDGFFSWLKQPSTIKAIGVLIGAIGWKFDIINFETTVEAVAGFYVVVSAFIDKN